MFRSWDFDLYFFLALSFDCRNIQRMHLTIFIISSVELYMKICSMTTIACRNWILWKAAFSIGMLHWESHRCWTVASIQKYRFMAIKPGEISISIDGFVFRSESFCNMSSLRALYHVLISKCNEFSKTRINRNDFLWAFASIMIRLFINKSISNWIIVL